MGKEAKTDAELEEMILQRLLIGGVFVSVRKIPCSVGVRRLSLRQSTTETRRSSPTGLQPNCVRSSR